MFNGTEPLWLPKGSVRALIALFVVIGGGAFLIFDGATEAVAATIGSVITWYFVKREDEAPSV